ncbi:hypothetical protein B0H10DRAFT_2210157 [Mycena sp. CBHHK59/15]|nr:hypothetical protein B0H10DRAFT_2210157 [Mycena sp. CBHHK59/15]
MSFSGAGLPALFSRESSHPTEHELRIDVFVVLQLLGLFGSIVLVLTTTLSSAAPRNATWQNFFTSWIISTVSYSLLAFSGQLNKTDPAFGVCLAQAGLIYGIPSLTAATTFGLIAQIWFSVQTLLAKKVKNERILTIGLLLFPYIILFAMVIASWVVGIRNPSLVQVIGSGMYCHIGPTGTLGRVSAALVALSLIPTLTLEIMICIALRKNWATFKRMKHSMSITLRVMIFTFVGILAITVSGIFVFSDSHGAGLNIVFAAMPVTTVIIFSTQNDIIQVWMFWKKAPQGKTIPSRSSESSSRV